MLSRREQEVLAWLARGRSAKAISRILGISQRTVEVHSASIVEKLGARNRLHAVAIAVHAGMAAPYDAADAC